MGVLSTTTVVVVVVGRTVVGAAVVEVVLDVGRAVAAGRNGWPLGPLLVLLRAFPRNYDQTWIGENPSCGSSAH